MRECAPRICVRLEKWILLTENFHKLIKFIILLFYGLFSTSLRFDSTQESSFSTWHVTLTNRTTSECWIENVIYSFSLTEFRYKFSETFKPISFWLWWFSNFRSIETPYNQTRWNRRRRKQLTWVRTELKKRNRKIIRQKNGMHRSSFDSVNKLKEHQQQQ